MLKGSKKVCYVSYDISFIIIKRKKTIYLKSTLTKNSKDPAKTNNYMSLSSMFIVHFGFECCSGQFCPLQGLICLSAYGVEKVLVS